MANLTIDLIVKPAPELMELLQSLFKPEEQFLPPQPDTVAPFDPGVQKQLTPVAPPPQPDPVAQTTERVYTLEELSRAGAEVVGAGKQAEAFNLMAQFGVQKITDLKPEQYGAFATGLRGLGAKI